MKLLRSLFRWIANVWGIDRIRVAKQTGRVGALVPGDRFVWQDSIYEVLSRESLSTGEYESEIQLEFVPWENLVVQDIPNLLRVKASSFPTISFQIDAIWRDHRGEVIESIDERDLCVLEPMRPDP